MVDITVEEVITAGAVTTVEEVIMAVAAITEVAVIMVAAAVIMRVVGIITADIVDIIRTVATSGTAFGITTAWDLAGAGPTTTTNTSGFAAS